VTGISSIPLRPPDDPSVLLHGDLLGQILLAMDGPHHVINWEYATRGDPAYDLAIVTRGVEQPFQIARIGRTAGWRSLPIRFTCTSCA